MLIHSVGPTIDATVVPKACPEAKVTQDTSLPTTKPHKSRWIKALKWTGYITGYGLLGLISILKTPGLQVAVNDHLQSRGLVPTPTNTRSTENEYNLDGFFMNYHGTEEVRDQILTTANSQSLDTNNNGIILDSQDEVQLLRQRLLANLQASKGVERQNQIMSAIAKLDEINAANLLIWGSNPDPSYLFQQGRPNCQLMGAIQAHYLTQENLQSLKSLIEVTLFNSVTGEVDTVVHLQNGRSIPVPFNDLVRWMSPYGLCPSYSADGTPEKPITLAVPILTYALEKELSDKYDGVPPTIPSSAPILLTGNNYTTVLISPYLLNVFTDNELANIFSMAPKRPIMLTSWGDLGDLNEWFNRPPNNNFQFLPQSDEKAREFRKTVESRSQLAISSSQTTNPNTQTQSSQPTSQTTTTPGISQAHTQNRQPQASSTSENPGRINIKNILRHHIYVVRGYNPQDQTVIIMDSHGTNSSIKLSEIRSIWAKDGMAAVIMPRDEVTAFSQESLIPYLLLLLVASGHFALHQRHKKRNQDSNT